MPVRRSRYKSIVACGQRVFNRWLNEKKEQKVTFSPTFSDLASSSELKLNLSSLIMKSVGCCMLDFPPVTRAKACCHFFKCGLFFKLQCLLPYPPHNRCSAGACPVHFTLTPASVSMRLKVLPVKIIKVFLLVASP